MTRTKIVPTHFPAVRKSTSLTDISLQQSRENRRQVAAVLVRHCLGGRGRRWPKRQRREATPTDRALVAFRSFLSWWPPLTPLPNKTAEGKEKRWAVEVTRGGGGRGSEEREGGAEGDEISGVSPLETVSHPGRLHKVPAASRGGGGRTEADGGPKKQNETEAININPHPDGRTDCSHVGRRREERGEATCRQGGGSFVVRGGEREREGSRSHTELMKPRVWFASSPSARSVPTERGGGHENIALKMGLR